MRLLAARGDEALVRAGIDEQPHTAHLVRVRVRVRVSAAIDEQPHKAHRRAARRVVECAEAAPVRRVHLGLRGAEQLLVRVRVRVKA